jgi:AraC-like DNA-binding protein
MQILTILNVLFFVLILFTNNFEVKRSQFYFVFLIFNTVVFLVNTYYLNLYFLGTGNLIFCCPFLYYFYYIKLNVGVLDFFLFRSHLLISTVFFGIAIFLYATPEKLFFEVFIVLYFLYYVFLLIQLLTSNYKAIKKLLDIDMPLIQNAIIVTFVFYFTFIICFINLRYNNKYFPIFFIIIFGLYNVNHFWTIANKKRINFKFFMNLKKVNPIYSLLPSKSTFKSIDFSYNWIKIPDSLKSSDQNLIVSMEPFISIYFLKLDSIHEKPYNPFFNSQDLSMQDFSNECNIPINHLRFLFKNYSKISFHEFKRMCQIKNAIYLIDNNYLKKDTLEALSKKVGFLSYSSFYVNFKKYTHLLPLEYLKRN